MNETKPNERIHEIAIEEKILSRLKTQMLVVYLVSSAVAAVIAWSLTWEYRVLSELASTRISEYQLLVAEGLDELHRVDLETVAIRTRTATRCETPLPEEDAVALLTRELGRPPESGEVRHLLETARGFAVCDVGEIDHLYGDAVNMAKVDTVYRLLLGRPADPIGRFIYGYWLASGVEVEVVGRDIMVSPEFHRLKKLSVQS